MVELPPCKRVVVGSIPTASSHPPRAPTRRPRAAGERVLAGEAPEAEAIGGGVPEWSKGTDCKSVAQCFGGSNPPAPTPFPPSRPPASLLPVPSGNPSLRKLGRGEPSQGEPSQGDPSRAAPPHPVVGVCRILPALPRVGAPQAPGLASPIRDFLLMPRRCQGLVLGSLRRRGDSLRPFFGRLGESPRS